MLKFKYCIYVLYKRQDETFGLYHCKDNRGGGMKTN